MTAILSENVTGSTHHDASAEVPVIDVDARIAAHARQRASITGRLIDDAVAHVTVFLRAIGNAHAAGDDATTRRTLLAAWRQLRDASVRALAELGGFSPDVTMPDVWDDSVFERAIDLGKLRQRDPQTLTIDVTPIGWQRAVTAEDAVPIRWTSEIMDGRGGWVEYTAELIGVRHVLGRTYCEFEIEEGDNLVRRCERCSERIGEAGPVGLQHAGAVRLFCSSKCRDAYARFPHRLPAKIDFLA